MMRLSWFLVSMLIIAGIVPVCSQLFYFQRPWLGFVGESRYNAGNKQHRNKKPGQTHHC